MGLFSSRNETALREYKAARRALGRQAADDKRRGIMHETPAYLKANARVLRAEKNVPWWRR